MGSNVTKTANKLCGFLVPYAFSETASTDYAVGTDYAEIERFPGAFVKDDSASGVSITGTGTPAASLTSLAFRPSKSGSPGDAEWRWSKDSGTTWYANTPHPTATGWSYFTSYQMTDDAHGKSLADGGFLFLTEASAGGAYAVTVTDEDFTAATAVNLDTDPDALTSPTSCIFRDPTDTDDSKWLVLAAGGTDSALSLDMHRTTDTGATWTKVARNVLGQLFAQVVRVRAGAIGGQVLCMVTTVSGGAYTTRQYVSTNGGASFTQVTSASNVLVGDIAVLGGYFHVSLFADVTGTAFLKAIRVGDASTSFLSDDGVTVRGSNVDHTITSAMQVGAGGVLWVTCRSVGAGGTIARFYSRDGGATWDQAGLYAGAGPRNVGNHALVFWREKQVLIGSKYDGTTETFSGQVYFFGSYSTVSEDVQEWPIVWGGSLAIDSTAGWTITESGGTATKTLNTTEYSVVTGAGVTWDAVAASSSVGGTGGAIFRHIFEVNSGSCIITCEFGNASTQASLVVQVTPTVIWAWGTGTTRPASTAHNVTGQIEVKACMNVATDEAEVYYRAFSPTDTNREWTSLTASNTLLGGSYDGRRHTVRVDASSDVDFRFLAAESLYDTPTPLAVTGPDEAEMPGIELPPMYGPYVEGLRIVSEGGLVYRSDDDHTSSLPSLYPKVDTLPRVNPSPSEGWRTDTAALTKLVYTFDAVNGEPVYLEGDALAVYLDGLVGVHAVNIKDGASSLTGGAASLGYAVDIERQSAESLTVRPVTSGTDDDGPYVEPDELKGWTIVFASGDARQITGNTEGTLGHGATVDTKRAIWWIDQSDGSESTSGTATLYPPRALFIIPFRGTDTYSEINVQIASGNMSTEAAGYVQVGLVAAGGFTFMGRAPDKTETVIVEANTETTEREDGKRRVRERGPARTRVTMSWVDDPIDVTQLGGDDTSPDYITSSAHASAAPAATRMAPSRVLRGIYNQAGGDTVPLVYADGLERDSGTGNSYQLYTFGRAHSIYGRFVGDVREERVPRVGKRRASEMVRVPTITIEEEV